MNFEMAKKLSELALIIAKQKKKSVAITVVDSHGELLNYQKMDAVSHHAAYLSQCKAYTAARECITSRQVGEYARKTTRDLSNWCDNKITGIAGGVPLFKEDRVIGALGIAGLNESEDEMLAYEIIDIFKQENKI